MRRGQALGSMLSVKNVSSLTWALFSSVISCRRGGGQHVAVVVIPGLIITTDPL